jgi:hypothetical protein
MVNHTQSLVICSTCTRKFCKTKPILRGRMKRPFCKKRIPQKAGFPIMELLIDTSPIALFDLVHRAGGVINKSKKGYYIKWN